VDRTTTPALTRNPDRTGRLTSPDPPASITPPTPRPSQVVPCAWRNPGPLQLAGDTVAAAERSLLRLFPPSRTVHTLTGRVGGGPKRSHPHRESNQASSPRPTHARTRANAHKDHRPNRGSPITYQIRYDLWVSPHALTQVREATGLSISELAARAGTSRPTLSAYEHRRVSPTLETFERILAAAGHRLTTTPVLVWREVDLGRAGVVAVPDRLPDLSPVASLRRLDLPVHLEWSSPRRTVDLSDRRQRARAYEVVLREGRPSDIEGIVDGALLVDLWDELVLPRRLRSEWQPLIDDIRTGEA